MKRISTRKIALAALILTILWGGIHEWNRGQVIKWNREAVIHDQFWSMVAAQRPFTADDMGRLARRFQQIQEAGYENYGRYIRVCNDDKVAYPHLPSSLRNELFWGGGGGYGPGILNHTGQSQLDALQWNTPETVMRGTKLVPVSFLSMVQPFVWSPFMLVILGLSLLRALWLSRTRLKQTTTTTRPRTAQEVLADASQYEDSEIQSRVVKLRGLLNAQGSAKREAEQAEKIEDLKGELDLAIQLAESRNKAEQVVYSSKVA